MKHIFSFIGIVLCLLCSCKKGKDSPTARNDKPTATLSANLIKVNPFTYKLTATTKDRESDPLTFSWDFGEGTKRQGKAEEIFEYQADKEYTVKVKVSDGKNEPAEASVSFNTKTTTVAIDFSKKFQSMDGFGGFGAQKEYWASAPFTSDEFVNTLINDLGLTILRDNLPTSFEITNDNNDPLVTDLTKYNISTDYEGHDETLADHLDHLKKMKAAGLNKLIVSIWTPAPWMKYNNKVGNGTTNTTSAPEYTSSPTGSTNQLKTDMYDEFAEYCVAYIKIIKEKTGIDIYALSVQNEPRFSQYYGSAVYNGEALKNVIKVVGKRIRDEGLATKLFVPEDLGAPGWLDGIKGMIMPTLNDPEARQYVSIFAVHGYDLDGVTATSGSANTWQTMYSWSSPYNIPLWMTETSGFENTMTGAIKMAKAMYTAIKFGNVSAWLHWSLSTTTLDAYSLMSSTGAKSKRYFVSKNFYRYIRPGAVRADASTPENEGIYPLAFQHTVEGATTIILINDKETGKPVKLSGSNLPAQFAMYVTSAQDDAQDYGSVNSGDVILLPANSVVTLYKKS